MRDTRPLLLAPLAVLLPALACGPSPTPAAPTVTPPPAETAAPSEPPEAGAPTADDAATPTQAATPTPAPAEEEGTPRERLMRAHFKETAAIRTAVIRGALSDAVAPAAALAKMDGLGKVQASWKPAVDVLQDAARKIGQSPDIPGASAAVADIGVACGSCHKVAGGPKITIDAPPAVDATLQSRMRRHVWANDRLWEGIFVPSDKAWKAGADALAGDPFPKEILDKGGVHARSAASQFKSLIATAGAKKKPEDRAKLYASLLETCSACHTATRGAKK